METLKTILIFALGGYAAVVTLLYVFQRSLMYFPDATRVSPAAAGLPQVEEIEFASKDGVALIGWHVPPRDGKPMVMYFQGNAGGPRWRAERFRELIADGTGLFALCYRGYGGSAGRPNEAGLILDAEAAYALIVARYPQSPLVLWGESLGTGVAIALAATHPVAAIMLDAPFTSAADVGAKGFPFVPVRHLIKDGFYSDRRITQVNAPLLVLHGERDAVVPIALGEKLFALAREPKRFVRFPAGAHVDLDAHGALAHVREFLAGVRRP